MIVYHASPRSNRESIGSRGLLTSFARTKWARIWLHGAQLSNWAVEHVADRHGVDQSQVDVWVVEIPAKYLRKFNFSVWTVGIDIPPEWLSIRQAHRVVYIRNGKSVK